MAKPDKRARAWRRAKRKHKIQMKQIRGWHYMAYVVAGVRGRWAAYNAALARLVGSHGA